MKDYKDRKDKYRLFHVVKRYIIPRILYVLDVV